MAEGSGLPWRFGGVDTRLSSTVGNILPALHSTTSETIMQYQISDKNVCRTTPRFGKGMDIKDLVKIVILRYDH